MGRKIDWEPETWAQRGVERSEGDFRSGIGTKGLFQKFEKMGTVSAHEGCEG